MKAPPINVSSTLLANTFKKPPSRLFRSHFRLAFPIRTHIRYSFFAFFLTFSPLAFRFSKYVCFPHRTTLVHVHMHTTTVSIYWVDTYTHTPSIRIWQMLLKVLLLLLLMLLLLYCFSLFLAKISHYPLLNAWNTTELCRFAVVLCYRSVLVYWKLCTVNRMECVLNYM